MENAFVPDTLLLLPKDAALMLVTLFLKPIANPFSAVTLLYFPAENDATPVARLLLPNAAEYVPMLSQFHTRYETPLIISLVSAVQPARNAALLEYHIIREPVTLSETSHSKG